MARTSMGPLLRHLRKILDPVHGPNTSDDELLKRFVQQRDEAAFELLVWRHQRMVLSVCRRVLGNVHDAEDAFQATFLTLARKADSLRCHRAVAAWLHQVAYHIAVRARKNAAKRKTESLDPAAVVTLSGPAEEAMRRDLDAVLDEEVSRLSEKYRLPVILCYLEGKTYQDVSRQLGVPLGTLSARLTRARNLLRRRLLRRGLVVSSAGLSAALMPDALASAATIPLVGALIRAAVGSAPAELMSARTLALTEGMLRMMFMTKVKMVLAASLVVALAAAGLATLSLATRAAETRVASAEEPHKETLMGLSQEAPNVGSLDQSDRAEPQDGIAWGKAAHGLQAGISFRPGDQTTYEVGQSVTFAVYLRNVSAKTIRVSHIEPWFSERPPQIEDAKGRRLAVAIGPINLGDVPIVHRSLEAREQITLGYPWFRIRQLGWRGEVLGPTCCAEPGQYKVGCMGLVLRLNDGEDISLGTKSVELNIGKPKVERGENRFDPFRPTSRNHEGKIISSMIPLSEETTNSAASPRLFYVPSRSLNIPVHLDSQKREQIAAIILLASKDNGETWQQIDRQPATARKFYFHAPEDGMYWFIVGTVDKQGNGEPKNLNRFKSSLRLCVDTLRPQVRLKATVWAKQKDRPSAEMSISWSATDANLDPGSLTLEWAENPEGPWHTVSGLTTPSDQRSFSEVDVVLPKYLPKRIHVRLRVRDKAGNETIEVKTLDIKSAAAPEPRP